METIPEKTLAGRKVNMSFAHNQTQALWQSFMPRKKELKNISNSLLYSLEVYPQGFFDRFNPEKDYQKWAAVEVAGFDNLPDEMETITVPEGLYAVFLHRGPAREAAHTYRYIFETWLPASEFAVDYRPHFAVMGEKYKADDAGSEEEIWIPVHPKN